MHIPGGKPLGDAVQLFWQVGRYNSYRKEVIIPKGIVEIIFNFSHETAFHARLLCYSPRHLSRKFHELSGMNTEQTILYLKYLKAKKLNHHSRANRYSLRNRAGIGFFSVALMALCAVLGGNLYQILVEVPNWSADIPDSLRTYRTFFNVIHAGYFFQTLIPLTFLCLVVSTFLLWNRPKSANRWMLAVLGGVVISEVFTIFYFIPRNIVLFLDPLDGTEPEQLMNIAGEWQRANYLRMVIVLATMGAFLKTYRIAGRKSNSDQLTL